MPRLIALDADCDVEAIRAQLELVRRICDGAGPVGRQTHSERFHWLVSPRSTVLQTSPVHCGLSDDPEATLEHLLKTMGSPARKSFRLTVLPRSHRRQTVTQQDDLLLQYQGPCPAVDTIEAHCTCPTTACPLHGRCCACVAWHRDHARKPLPHCLRELDRVCPGRPGRK